MCAGWEENKRVGGGPGETRKVIIVGMVGQGQLLRAWLAAIGKTRVGKCTGRERGASCGGFEGAVLCHVVCCMVAGCVGGRYGQGGQSAGG